MLRNPVPCYATLCTMPRHTVAASYGTVLRHTVVLTPGMELQAAIMVGIKQILLLQSLNGPAHATMTVRVSCPICLRVRYPMPGTDLSVVPRSPYARAMQSPALTLLSAYARALRCVWY
eukprot:2666951-Rhodomonas_salina.3